jgi:muconolactone delta-isomerase
MANKDCHVSLLRINCLLPPDHLPQALDSPPPRPFISSELAEDTHHPNQGIYNALIRGSICQNEQLLAS